MLRFLAASLAICVSTCAFGAATVTGNIIEVRIDKSGRGMVTFNQPLAGEVAACRHSGNSQSLAFDTNTSAGRAILALVLAAKATGETVTASSTGDCSIYDNNWVEDWESGSVQ